MMQVAQTHKLQWLSGNGKITAECSCSGWSNTFLYMDLIARAQAEEQLTHQFEQHVDDVSKMTPAQAADYNCRLAGSSEEAQKLVDGW